MRRLAARTLAVAVVASGLVPLSAGASWACSCVPSPPDQERYAAAAAEATTVYVAQVVRETLVATPQGYNERRYEVVVSTSLKGGARGTRTLTTAEHESTCGVRLEVDRPVLVTSEQVSLCGTTTQQQVGERKAFVEAALHRAPTSYATVAGDTLRTVARTQLREQLAAEPSAAHVETAARVLHRANRKLLGPRPGPLPAGTRLVVPRLS